jgi:hypothetical protein
MIFNHREPVLWWQLEMVYDLPEIDEKNSLFHYVNDVIWLFLTYCKNIYLILKRLFHLLLIDLFVSEAEITK